MKMRLLKSVLKYAGAVMFLLVERFGFVPKVVLRKMENNSAKYR